MRKNFCDFCGAELGEEINQVRRGTPEKMRIEIGGATFNADIREEKTTEMCCPCFHKVLKKTPIFITIYEAGGCFVNSNDGRITANRERLDGEKP